MKIERPKCEEYVLFLASQSYSQRVVVKVLSECIEAKQLESALAGITLWPWDRGDLLCWASVLNVFDDFLLIYVVEKELGGFTALKSFTETLNQGVGVSGVPSDNLILSILDVTYFILFNSSSRWVYNSISLLIALLDSFNPVIVCGAFQCLCLIYSSLRNKRRPAESAVLNEILLRLPFFSGDPLVDLEEKARDKPSTHLTQEERQCSSLKSSQCHNQSERLAADRLSGLCKMSVELQEETSTDFLKLSEACYDSTTQKPLDGLFFNDENVGEFLRLYNGQFRIDPELLQRQFLCLLKMSKSSSLNTEERRIPYAQLLDGFSPCEIGYMSLSDISNHQYRIFKKLVSIYVNSSSSNEDTKIDMCDLDEAQLQEIRQKLRHLWWAFHQEGRQRLVDIRLNAFSTMIAVNPQFFLNYLGTFSTLLTDLTLLLRFHYTIHARTLSFVLDLWTSIIQDDLQRRAVTFLLGLASPHGLFPTLVFKFLKFTIGNNKEIPLCLVCPSTTSNSIHSSECPVVNEESKSSFGVVSEESKIQFSESSPSNDPACIQTNVMLPSNSFSEVASPGSQACGGSAAQSSVPPPIVILDPDRFSVTDISCLYEERSCVMYPNPDSDLFLDPGGSPQEFIHLLCQVLERLMELILSVKMTSMFPLTAISHTTLLKCLVDFTHVLNPVFLPVIIRTCRIFESLVDVVPVVDGVLDILVTATNTLQSRLQYEVVKLSSLPVFDTDTTRIVESPLDDFRHLIDISSKDPRYRHWTIQKAEQALQDLSSNNAVEVLHLVQEITHRRSLIYFIFRQLDACIHGSNPGFTRRIVDLYSGPCCLASRFVFQHPFDFGLGVYGVAATLLGDYLAEDPSVQPTLTHRGLISDFLNSISEHILPSEDALQAISLCLTSILLHNSGDTELQKLNYSPIYTLISVVTREQVVGFDRVGELMTIMGNRLGDAAKNQEKAEYHIIEATLRMVKSITELAYELPPWTQVPPSEANDILNEYLMTCPASTDVLRLPPMPTCRYLSDRLANMARFLQAMLRSFKMIMLFINRKGVDYVLQAAIAPSLPPLFLRVLPHHPLNGLLRMLVTSGADLSVPNSTGNTYPSFVKKMVETIPKLVPVIDMLPKISARVEQLENFPDLRRGTSVNVVEDIQEFLKSISQLDVALYLLLATNKDTASYSMTISSLWSRGQHLPFIKLACYTFVHLHTLFPNLLSFIYQHTQIHATDTPSILITRHCCHEHPGVRASKKYLSSDAQPLQATKFFWSSLARFAYSVPNPCFVTNSSNNAEILENSYCTAALIFEVIRSTCVQCRLIISLASRFINKVTMGRARTHQGSTICADRLATASYIALTARKLLQDIPTIPLPGGTESGILNQGLSLDKLVHKPFWDNVVSVFQEESNMEHEDQISKLLSAPGHTPFQTARYISEVMDILFRLHVNERSEGCLFTLTLDTFYKVGGVFLVIKSFHYCFGLLIAMSVHSVCHTKQQNVDSALKALAELIGVKNIKFIQWIRAMLQKLDKIPQELFKTASDIVFKCLHCCMSYCEKITSWKRLYNSLITEYLQKAWRTTSASKVPSKPGITEDVSGPSGASQRSGPCLSFSDNTNHSAKHVVGVGSSCVKLSGLFKTCLPPCGSGGVLEFDAAVLLRSIQGETTRNLFSWIEGFFCRPPEMENSLCYHLLYETLMAHFSTKAVNCLIKICFHLFDAESPPKKKNTISWQEDLSCAVDHERREQTGGSNAAESYLCDTLDQLVERQLSATSPQIQLELTDEEKSFLSLARNTETPQEIRYTEAASCQKVDACVQTDIHSTFSIIYLGFRNCEHAVDWSQEDSTSLLNYIKSEVVQMLLDVGRCMLNYPSVIAEVILRLVALPFHFGSPESLPSVSDADSEHCASRKAAEHLKPAEPNGRYVTRCLIKRLNDIYNYIVSMDEVTKDIFLHVPWNSCDALYDEENQSQNSNKMFFSDSYIDNSLPRERSLCTENLAEEFSLLDEGKHTMFGLYKSHGSNSGYVNNASSLQGTESLKKISNEKERVKLNPILVFKARRVHEALHNYLYIFVNLLHRSSVVRQAFSSEVIKALNFFHKFVSLMVVSRKSVFFNSTFQYVKFSEFSTGVLPELGVVTSNPSSFLSSVKVPTWCTKPCKPYLLTNTLAEKAVNNIVTAEFKKDPVNFDSSQKSPLTLYQKEPEFPYGSQPPQWFACCFLGMEMSLLLYELDHSCSPEFLSPVYGKKSSRLISVETQSALINTCLDVLYFFPGLGGSLTTVILNLLVHLTSIVSNATQLLLYKPSPSIDLPAGGLSVLLSLPRTTHFTGILRLMSAILFNVCENKFTLEMRLKKELAQYISSQGVLKKFNEKTYKSNGEHSLKVVQRSIPKTSEDLEKSAVSESEQQEKTMTNNKADGDCTEQRVVSLDALLVNLYIYLRRDPGMFKRILMQDCIFYFEVSPSSEGTTDEAAVFGPADGAETTETDANQTSNPRNCFPTAQRTKFPQIYVAYKPKLSAPDEALLSREINLRGSQVLLPVLNYLDLFITIQAHTRLTPSFADILAQSSEHIKPFAGSEAKNFLMYPFALLPDSLLFLLDELLSTTPQYIFFFLEKLVIDPSTQLQEHTFQGMMWVDENISSNTLLRKPWGIVEFEMCPPGWNLVTWLIRYIFPKLITLSSSASCSTAEWKEGEKLTFPLFGTLSDIADLNALAASNSKGSSHRTLDILLHFSTRLLRRLCLLDTKIAQQSLLEFTRVLLELECATTRSPKDMDQLSCKVAYTMRNGDAIGETFFKRKKKKNFPHALWSLALCSAASTLWGIFELCANSGSILNARQLFKSRKRKEILSASSLKQFLGQMTASALETCCSPPTVKDILILKSCVIRLLAIVDLSSYDAQPLCRSLIRLLECLIRDPVFLLILFGVPDSLISVELAKCEDNSNSESQKNFRSIDTQMTCIGSCSANADLGSLRLVDNSVFNNVDSSSQHSSYRPYMSNSMNSVRDVINTSMFNDISNGICQNEFPLNISTRSVAGDETEDDDENLTQENGTVGLEDSVDEEDENSSDVNDDIIMEEQEEAISLSLPHEADEHEDSEAYFGLPLPRIAGSDSDSEGDDFDEDEDIPRIRDDDEDAEIMLLMPDDLSRSQLMNMHDTEVDRSVQLLAVGDDDDDDDDGSGTPGLLHSGERMCREHFDEDMSNSNITMVEDEEEHDISDNSMDDDEDEDEDDDNEHDGNAEEDGLRNSSDRNEHSRYSASSPGALEIILRNSSNNDIVTSLPSIAEMLSHDGSDSFVSNVHPFSFEVLYACPSERHANDSERDQHLNVAQQSYGASAAEVSNVNNLEEEEEASEDGEADDDDAELSLELTIPNIAASSLSNVTRLGGSTRNDNVQFNVGFDMVVPSRIGNSPIASLYLSFPTTFSNGPHRSVSGTTFSIPADVGVQTRQSNVGWTSPGDLALPIDSSVLLSPHAARRATGTNNTFDVVSVPTGVTSVEQNVSLPYSFQNSIRQRNRLEDSYLNVSGNDASQISFCQSQNAIAHFNIPSLFALGHIVFDPWSQVVVTLLRSGTGDTNNTYSTSARTAWLRSRLWGSRNPEEYRGLNVVLSNFRHWFHEEKSIDRRLCQPSFVHTEEQLPEDSATDPNHSDTSLIRPDVSQEGVNQRGQMSGRTAPVVGCSASELDTDEQPAPIPMEVGSSNDVPHQTNNDNDHLYDQNNNNIVPSISLEDAYVLLRHEEATNPLGFSSQLVRHVALLLGLTSRQLLSILGIDLSFISEIPEDIQTDIISQQLPSICFSNFRECRQENMNRLAEVVSQFSFGFSEINSTDITGIRLLSATNNVIDSNERDDPINSTQIASPPTSNPSISGCQDHEITLPEPSSNLPETSSSARTRCWHIDPASINIDQSILSVLPVEVNPHLTINSLNNTSTNQGYFTRSDSTQRNVDFSGEDNATFLATLDTALREDLLLTVAEEELNALPAEYVAQAALLRNRSRRQTAQNTGTSTRNYRNLLTGLSRQTYTQTGQRGPISAERVRLISTRPSNNSSLDNRHNNDLHQLYNALFNAMQLTFPRNTSLALQSSGQGANGASPGSESSGLVSTRNNSFQDVVQDVGMAFRPTSLSLSGMYTGASSASRRLISDALDQILGDVDSSIAPVIQSTNRYESRSLEPNLITNSFNGTRQPESQLYSMKDLPNRISVKSCQDLLSCVRYSSLFDIPVDESAILIICRLLFLKKQVYRRDMHRLFFSLAASHKSTRNQLLQFLMVVLWNAVADLQASFNLPRASHELLALGFPPERLYFSLKLATSLLFDGHTEVASSIAGYRALEHIRSLLEVIPNVSEFFALYTSHPACVCLTPVDAQSPTCSESNRSLKHTELSTDCPSNLESFTENAALAVSSEDAVLYAKQENQTTDALRGQSTTLSTVEKNEKEVYEYPINILLTLTKSRLFHTSSNHMIHLLSAIDFLLCGSQQSASSSNTVAEVTSSPPGQNGQTNDVTVSENERQDDQNEFGQQPQRGLSVESPSLASRCSLSKKILNVVSRDAALTICRLFTGTPLINGEMSYNPTFLNMYYASASNQSPLPILSRIVALLYWSTKHHEDIHVLLVSSLKSLVTYISRYLEALKTHVLNHAQLYSPVRNEKAFDTRYDLLAPEHIRTPLDISLNLLLRLTISLQDVFWSNPAATASVNATTRSQETSQRAQDERPSNEIDVTVQPSETQAPPDHETGTEEETSSSDMERAITEDKKSLVMLKDLFNVVGMPKLWRITDDLLRTIELACPFLLQHLTDSLSGAGTNSGEDSAFNNFSGQINQYNRNNDQDTFVAGGSSVTELTNNASPMPRRTPYSTSDSRVNLPLVVSQLLPLINSYLIVHQICISADLGFRASEVPRVAVQVLSNRTETLHQQKFSEQLSQYISGSEKKLTKSHSEFISFCERHRKVLNLLIQNSPGILNGPFQPLVALAALCLSFENKRQYFRHSLKQLRDATRYEPIRLNVRRNMVFMDSFHQLRLRNGEEMKGKLIVHFQGEEGIDAGGLVREWYGILAKEMFNPDYALFRREGTKSEFNHPNPLSHVNPDHLCFFKFVGRVIGKAIYDGHHLGSYFTRSFYKQMLGKKTLPSDAECIDPEFYKSLQLLLAHNISDLGLDLRFSTDIDEFGRTQIVDLIPRGRSISVTEENKHEYVRLLCEHKISQSIRLQTESFLEGFHELIPPRFLTIFDDKELELLISGISFVDIEDLRANTVYHNYEPTSPQIYWFWDTLAEMDQNALATFLQFVTGTSRVPLGGFRELMGVCGPQLFSIHRDYDETRLPSAHTCFNQLDLPQYPSREILKEKLLKAISEGSEGFGFA